MQTLLFFKWSILVTVVALGAAALYDGLTALVLVAVLIALEISISFDNAVVNATVLRGMSRNWQRVFLTVGILIAVVGMRLVFPIAIVAVATKLGFTEVLDLALNDQKRYAESVEAAKPVIGGFGGAFLLMVALEFLIDGSRETHWLGPIERGLSRAGKVAALPVAITLAAVVATSQIAPKGETDVLLAGAIGIVAFVAMHGISESLGVMDNGGAKATGMAGLAGFAYLELLDASFSLDGVLGAFAITTDIVVIALGLGVGAIYIRSLTVYLVRREALQQYIYLEHGAHWAIGALGVVLLVTVGAEVPEWLTATIGLGTVAAAFASSVARNRREAGSA